MFGKLWSPLRPLGFVVGVFLLAIGGVILLFHLLAAAAFVILGIAMASLAGPIHFWTALDPHTDPKDKRWSLMFGFVGSFVWTTFIVWVLVSLLSRG